MLKKSTTKLILPLSILNLFVFGCATPTGNTQKLVSASPVTVVQLNEQGKEDSTEVKANEAFTVTGPVARIEEPGHLPLLVVNPNAHLVSNSNAQPIEVNLRSLEEWKPENTDRYISGQMDFLYIDLLQIITAAKERKTADALTKIDSVIKRYPKLASAYYVKAQVEVLAGHPAEAVSTLDLALKLRPEFQQAIALKEQLRSKKSL
jgi:tetratricopeptide (TPR) repeat protein